MTSRDNDHKALIEAAIFAAGKALSTAELAQLSGISEEKARMLADDLSKEYADRRSGIELRGFDDKYVMQVRPSLAREVISVAPREIEAPLIRTLAIIAYKQPISQSNLAKIRGNKSYSHVRELEQRGLVKSERKGRTRTLTTTRGFAEYFGLTSDSPDIIRREFLSAPGSFGLTPMYKSLGIRLGLDFIVVNPYRPGDEDFEKLKGIRLLVIAPGYAEMVREYYSGELIEAEVRTFSQLKKSAEIICKSCGGGRIKELNGEIDGLLRDYQERAAGAKGIKPLTAMVEDIVKDLQIPIQEDGVSVAPDYANLDAQILLPTHQTYDMDILDRIKQRYDALLAGFDKHPRL